MTAMLPTFLPGLALALGIGLLVGFERGWQLREEAPGQRVAGVRTFATLGLLGGLAGLAAHDGLLWLGLVVVAAACAALIMAHAIDMRRDQTVSATAAIAALITILLGGLATSGNQAMAAVAAAALVALLSARKPLHALLADSSEDDVKALVRLSLVIFLVLPLLPDANLGPYHSLNPRRLWYVVVVVASISFSGYALSRWLGGMRGGLVAAAFGAFVSSTAVTLAAANAIKRGGGAANQAGIMLATAIMLARTIVLVGLIAPLVLNDVVRLIGPGALLAAVTAGILLWMTWRKDGVAPDPPTAPPRLTTALLFAVWVAVMTVAAAGIAQELGPQSAALLIALGGLADIDSAIAAVGALPQSALSADLAAIAIALPAAFNTLFKMAITLSVAGWRGGRWAAAALLLPSLVIAAGVAALLL